MVYKAKDLLKVEAQDRSPYVAIKVLSDEFKAHPEAFIALQRESRKTQLIAHPNIVNVFDFDKDHDTVFMTMELLEGTPLDKLINQYRATGLPKDDAWNILEGMCAALKHAHAENVIHSDFKPGNIFVTDKGLTKVFDFGIARAVSKAESHEDDFHDKTVFDAGNFGALTPAYASNEMLEGLDPDVTDDIYALGCIAYEMFTGRHPFDRVHANEAKKQNLKAIRDPVFTKRQWKIIDSALSFERDKRVQTVDEFWRELVHKRASPVKMIVAVTVIVLLVMAVAYLSFFDKQEVGISADEVRSQIEQQLRLEQLQARIDALIKSSEFSEVWERTLASEINELSMILKPSDEWLVSKRSIIYSLYINKIEQLIADFNLVAVNNLLINARTYAGDITILDDLTVSLEKALVQQEKREKEQRRQDWLAKQKNIKSKQLIIQQKINKESFDQALANVNEQAACRRGLNMRDLDIAIGKLRQINRRRYEKDESRIVNSLSSCIASIGRNFPERAGEYKKIALTIFPNNENIKSIAINPKDPCNKSLAGLGARGKRTTCYDGLENDNRAPALVVIPAKGSIRSFAITKHEVSNEDYLHYCRDVTTCSSEPANNDLPVIDISLQEVNEYIQWLTQKTSHIYRLPTKTEWLYAAKANSDINGSNRNCQLNSRGIQKGNALLGVSVGSQNKWGLVNHVGNAQEFVTDNNGDINVMGGSYKTPMENCTIRLSELHTGDADSITGFRLIRELLAY